MSVHCIVKLGHVVYGTVWLDDALFSVLEKVCKDNIVRLCCPIFFLKKRIMMELNTLYTF